MTNITKQLEKLAAAPAGKLRRIAKTWVLFVPKSYGAARFSIDGQEFDIDGAVARLTEASRVTADEENSRGVKEYLRKRKEAPDE